MSSTMREYVYFKMTIGFIKNWDKWQTAIKSKHFKNPLSIKNCKKGEKNEEYFE